MRSLMPWGREGGTAATPWRDEDRSPLFGFRSDIERLFDEVFRGSLPALRGERGSAWPTLEVSENDKEIRVTAEVPGMSDKDVELLIEDGVLTIRGERKSETEDKQRGYTERYYGRFERRIALPRGVDEEHARADFRDGVLTVTLPKSEEAERGRRIPISASASQ
jgi:HSP20 family protein